MKIIIAMVQPFMLSKVTSALEEIEGFPGMTVIEARGFGREKAEYRHGAPHRSIDDFVEYVNKERIEVVARDEMVNAIVETIKTAARTGNPGDGKIFVWPIEQAVRIQTGETGDEAV